MRHKTKAGWVVLACAATLMLFRLGEPGFDESEPRYVFDECYQAFTANRYVAGDGNAWEQTATVDDMRAFQTIDVSPTTRYEWTHPPAAKLAMAGLIATFGFHPAAYRLGSVVAGLVLLLVFWRLAQRIVGASAGLVALALVATDGLFLILSRTAMSDIYVSAAIIAAMYAMYRFWTDPAPRPRWLFVAGLALGIGIASKWSAAPALVGCAIASLPAVARCRRLLASWLVGFALLPAAVYLTAYLPYLAAGHSLADLWELHGDMWEFHRGLSQVHPDSSPWYSWPLAGTPVRFYAAHGPGVSRTITAIGNPVLWGLFLPSLCYVALRFVAARRPSDLVILLAVGSTWLPWAFVDRAGFVYYFMPAMPFATLAVVIALRDLGHALGTRTRPLPAVFAIVCLGFSAAYYPSWTALPRQTRVPARPVATVISEGPPQRPMDPPSSTPHRAGPRWQSHA